MITTINEFKEELLKKTFENVEDNQNLSKIFTNMGRTGTELIDQQQEKDEQHEVDLYNLHHSDRHKLYLSKPK